jgi:hypothetical protein
LSYISILLNKIINRPDTSKKVWEGPLSSEGHKTLQTLGTFNGICGAFQVWQSNHFKDKESKIKKPAPNLNLDKRKQNKTPFTPGG